LPTFKKTACQLLPKMYKPNLKLQTKIQKNKIFDQKSCSQDVGEIDTKLISCKLDFLPKLKKKYFSSFWANFF
jgi:hypothetical protein